MLRTITLSAIALAGLTLSIGLSQNSLAQDRSSQASTEPVLIELFTSQGCSSCPPADRLAQRLNLDKGLVVISRPVDYWDRLGWKDTLARPQNTDLQRAYARQHLAGYNGVYTPQTVVAGRFGEVGSNETALRQQVRRAQASDTGVRLRAKAVSGAGRAEGFAIGIAGPQTVRGELMLVGVLSSSEVSIGRGENGGRTLRYTNALIDEIRISNFEGGSQSVQLDADRVSIPGADRYALILRERAGGKVLAARWLE